ncbi:uncharacterized protein FTOL_04278 [Fusarium torulosum]|uniref:Uncharacterized protein n=1 Tax=Fusarium torulosum TaxID=33205 RepID=A0AAE8M5I4_9HYPO|nr:uncharacterized protein FTOL_04278 [Fusarium torulosum]
MCGIVPFFRGLYEDVVEAIDDLFPKRSTDTTPLMDNRQSFQFTQPHQQAYTSAARPVAAGSRRATERLEVRTAAARMPSPPRGPPTR